MSALHQWWNRQDEATRELPGYLRRAVINFLRTGTRQSAALAYYAIFSIFPLGLLLAALIGALLGPVAAQAQIASAINLFLPEETTSILLSNIAGAVQQGSSFTVIALAGLLWSALGLFSNVTFSLDVIFMVPSRRNMWRQRLVALLMTLFLVILISASFLTSAVLRLFSATMLGQPSAWISLGMNLLPFGLNLVIFALLLRYVPARAIHWDAVWPSAILGAVGWELAKSGLIWYTTRVADFQFIYGGIATAIVLLLWAYILAAVFLFSAEVCAQLNEWFLMQEQTRVPLIVEDDADAVDMRSTRPLLPH